MLPTLFLVSSLALVVIQLVYLESPGYLNVVQILGGCLKVCLIGRIAYQQLILCNYIVNSTYVCSILVYLLMSMVGDSFLVDVGGSQPVSILPGLYCYLVGDLLLFLAFSSPSYPKALLPNGTHDFFGRLKKDTYKMHPATLSGLRVPLHALYRGCPVLLPTLIACFVGGSWVTLGETPRFTALACLAVLHSLVLYRALARVGYLSPLVTSWDLLQGTWERRKVLAWSESGGGGEGGAAEQPSTPSSPSFSPTAALLQAEERIWQWCGVIGVVLSAASFTLSTSYRLALQGDARSVGNETSRVPQCTAALLSYLAALALCASTPTCKPTPERLPLSCDDPSVCPTPTLGPSLQVLVVVPSSEEGGWDASEATALWYYLTRRGHTVVFGVRGERGIEGANTTTSNSSGGGGGGGSDGGGGGVAVASSSSSSSLLLSTPHSIPSPRWGSVWGYFSCTLPLLSPGLEGSVVDAMNGEVSTPTALLRDRMGSAMMPPPPVLSRGGRSSGRRGSSRGKSGSSMRGGGGAGGRGGGFLSSCLPCLSGRRRQGLAMSCCPSTLACSPWEFRGVGGLGGPLLAAMFTEMVSSPSFKAPIGLGEALGLRGGEDNGGGGSGGGGEDRGGKGTGTGTGTATATLPAFDGLVVLGALGACGIMGSGVCAWEDSHLQSLVASFWAAGQPVGLFSTAVCLAAVTKRVGKFNRQQQQQQHSLLHGKSSVAPTLEQEGGLAWVEGVTTCQWRALRAFWKARKERRCAEDVVRVACGREGRVVLAPPEATLNGGEEGEGGGSRRPTLLSHLVKWFEGGGDSALGSTLPGLKPPRPLPQSHACITQDGHYLSAQSGGDAWPMAKLFSEKLEQSGRTF